MEIPINQHEESTSAHDKVHVLSYFKNEASKINGVPIKACFKYNHEYDVYGYLFMESRGQLYIKLKSTKSLFTYRALYDGTFTEDCVLHRWWFYRPAADLL